MTRTIGRNIIWRPTPHYIGNARITRFMRQHGISNVEALQRRSVEDPEWYWDAIVRGLGIRFLRPYERVLDDSLGIAWPRWFPGGLMNGCRRRVLCRPGRS